MTDSSRSPERGTRTTNALLVLILVTLAAGFLYVGDGTAGGTRDVAKLILTAMLWLPLFGGTVLLINRL